MLLFKLEGTRLFAALRFLELKSFLHWVTHMDKFKTADVLLNLNAKSFNVQKSLIQHRLQYVSGVEMYPSK